MNKSEHFSFYILMFTWTKWTLSPPCIWKKKLKFLLDICICRADGCLAGTPSTRDSPRSNLYFRFLFPLCWEAISSAPSPRYWCSASKVTRCRRIITIWTTRKYASGYFSNAILKALNGSFITLVSSTALAFTVLYGCD